MLGCAVLALVEPLDEDSVVAGDAEQTEPDDEQAGDRSRGKRGHAAPRDTPLRCPAVRTFGVDRNVHPDEAGGRQKTAPIRKPNAVPHPRSFHGR